MKEKKNVYLYGMRLRGFSPGCQPMDGLIQGRPDPTGQYHDLLKYDRKLTEAEETQYDLAFIGNVGTLEVTQP